MCRFHSKEGNHCEAATDTKSDTAFFACDVCGVIDDAFMLRFCTVLLRGFPRCFVARYESSLMYGSWNKKLATFTGDVII